MIYSEEKSAGLAFPLIAILLAIVGILAVLVATGGRAWQRRRPRLGSTG